ncbi:Tm-1-like ATP-binding domain-containing protein [Aurantibacter crassamenti]|uniref:Tm-1-like ATP-binding domain-containing protein n=1 Tax=Aurantibacter crassamenti TaxID=1837375 RepID=UPI001939D0E4|nr:Tm-1-like ATP-binding domain-containing protein [Aurantibacter crassamenti]MBM1105720.1 Tm-1-like ATP-binding domain-containing protein [Aurantibacter crassamenti]
MSKSVLIVGCYDTKGEDFSYLHSCLIKTGLEVLTLNTGIFDSQATFKIDFDSDDVAKAGGSNIMQLRKAIKRSEALDIMGAGAAKIITKLCSEKNIDGIIGMGGGGGTYMAITAMQAVPFGIPKLCLSTLATKDLSQVIGAKDITLMPSLVDINGLNSISRILIQQAAGAISGMIKSTLTDPKTNSGTIAISVFGNTSLCAERCTELLKAKNYDVLSFHAVGTGGKTMESLTLDGCFDAILDLTTTELADDLCGGICSAGPNRLESAAKIGIPQVVAPGCLDMVNFGALDTVPQKYKNRHLFSWAPDVTLMRTNEEENEILGKTFAEKLNKSTAPVTVILPLGGTSKISAAKGAFCRPDIDAVLFNSIKKNLNEKIQVIEVEANINTIDFAEHAIKSMLELLEK